MKKLILFLSLFIGVAAFSQETTEQKQEIISTEFDKAAEFPGGLNAIRRKISENFDTSKITGNGMFTTKITFIVDENGDVSDITAEGKNARFNEAGVDVTKK